MVIEVELKIDPHIFIVVFDEREFAGPDRLDALAKLTQTLHGWTNDIDGFEMTHASTLLGRVLEEWPPAREQLPPHRFPGLI